MLNSEGELKIADFGISRSISESMIMVTGKLGSTGSPPYISPQQWDGDQPSPLDDIYSVGATLYELLTSKPPLLGVVDWQQVHHFIPPPMWRRRNDLGITGAGPSRRSGKKQLLRVLPRIQKTDLKQSSRCKRGWQHFLRKLRRKFSHAEDSVGEEVVTQDFSDTTIVIPRVPSPPEPEVPAAPLVIQSLPCLPRHWSIQRSPYLRRRSPSRKRK